MMADNNKRPYMGYLSNPNLPVPKRTLYRKAFNADQQEEPMLQVHHEVASLPVRENSIFEEVESTCMYDLLSSLYDSPNLGVRQNEDEETCEDDNENIELAEEDSQDYEEMMLDEDDEFELTENSKICENSNLTFHEFAVLIMTLKTSFNLSGISLSFMLKIMQLALPEGNKIPSLNSIHKYFQGQNILLRKHHYCGFCNWYIGIETKTKCDKCGKSDIQFFVDLPLEEELKRIIENNWTDIDYRFKRKHQGDEYISDVYDGELYQQHFKDGGFLQHQHNFSLIANTDGVAIFKSSSFNVWPIYMVINELPPRIRYRRQNRILCGLWFGKAKPSFTTFFKPFAEQIWKLYSEGFSVSPPLCSSEVTCHAFMLQMTCDSPAKCLFQDFIQFNGYFGCPYCLHAGESCVHDSGGRSHVYPYKAEEENGYGEGRSHEMTNDFAITARSRLMEGKKKFAEKGVKGLSWGLLLPKFDIISGMCLDYMHAVLLGVMKQFLNLWFSKDHKKADWTLFTKGKAVKERLGSIKPPNNITRVPRSVDELAHWKASEFRSFLLFYGPVCLLNLLKPVYYDHFMLLSTAVWILLQQAIPAAQLEEARCHLQYFVFQTSTLYREKDMTFSVHLLLHLVETVKQNGPLWCHSCFPFEDYNGELRQFFHSSTHPEQQVARAVAIVQLLPEMVNKLDENSLASTLVLSMTSDRYKTKLLTETQPGVYLVGVGEDTETASKESLFSALNFVFPFHHGNIKLFKRALVRGHMIHSQKYSKVRQRNSYTVSYAQHGEICYGEVLFFAEVVDPEIDESSAYAFVKGYVKKDMNLVADLTTNLKTYGLLIFEKERQDGIRLVRLENINQKIVLMESEHMFIGGIFPNFYEKD